MPEPTPQKFTRNQLEAIERLQEIQGRSASTDILSGALSALVPPAGFGIALANFLEAGERNKEIKLLLQVINGERDMDVRDIKAFVNPELYG